MKILLVSDIHSNLTALQAVLEAAGNIDEAWCLGDLVGYGPDPNECIDLVRQLPNLKCVKGNHDLALSTEGNLDVFNKEASDAILVSRKFITAESISFLRSLPERVETTIATLVHGSPANPFWEYILEKSTASINFEFFNTRLACVGHSHLPLLFTSLDNGLTINRHLLEADALVDLPDRAIVNPGSVGQPRDNDPRSSYGIFDPVNMTWQIHRVEYDIPSVQKRIIEAGLPKRHAQRLEKGW